MITSATKNKSNKVIRVGLFDLSLLCIYVLILNSKVSLSLSHKPKKEITKHDSLCKFFIYLKLIGLLIIFKA